MENGAFAPKASKGVGMELRVKKHIHLNTPNISSNDSLASMTKHMGQEIRL